MTPSGSRRVWHEIVVFVSYENARPADEIADDMLAVLRIGRAEVGHDLLTGGCEVRLFYDPLLLNEVREYLAIHGIIHEISLL